MKITLSFLDKFEVTLAPMCTSPSHDMARDFVV